MQITELQFQYCIPSMSNSSSWQMAWMYTTTHVMWVRECERHTPQKIVRQWYAFIMKPHLVHTRSRRRADDMIIDDGKSPNAVTGLLVGVSDMINPNLRFTKYCSGYSLEQHVLSGAGILPQYTVCRYYSTISVCNLSRRVQCRSLLNSLLISNWWGRQFCAQAPLEAPSFHQISCQQHQIAFCSQHSKFAPFCKWEQPNFHIKVYLIFHCMYWFRSKIRAPCQEVW